MDTLKTIGKRMKPIFVFVLLEALLAGNYQMADLFRNGMEICG